MGTLPPDLNTTQPTGPYKSAYTTLLLKLNSSFNQSLYDSHKSTFLIFENFTDDDSIQCTQWDESQHMLYHLGNLCITVSFLTLSSFKYHYIFLRSMTLVGFVPLAMWAAFMKHLLDIVLWYVTFLLINIMFIAHYAYVHYHPKLDVSIEELYNKTFKPLKVTNLEYESLVRIGNVKMLNSGISYAVEDSTMSGYRISILLRGRLKVTHNDFFLHHISPDEFIDSIEYECLDTSQQSQNTYQVTITAEEDCSLITWQQNELDEFLSTNAFLAVLMRNLLGRDISTKMYHIQELLLAGSRKKRKQTNSTSTTKISRSPRTHSTDYIRLNSITNEDDQSEPLLAKSTSYETCV